MKLGEWCLCTHELERKQKGVLRAWGFRSITPVKVLVVGKRMLSDGEVHYEDETPVFTALHKFQGIKVAPNLTTEFYCLPEHLLAITAESAKTGKPHQSNGVKSTLEKITIKH